MTELSKTNNRVQECGDAGYIDHYEIDIPLEFDLYEMREWFLVMQGYAKCLEDVEGKNKEDEKLLKRFTSE